MGYLLVEENFEDVELIVENVKGIKKYFIRGNFAQAEIQNRNGRSYPKHILEREVNNFNENYVSKNRSWGELGHPSTPTINLDKVSHIIRELKQDGNNFVGRAEILDTPHGKIVQQLLDAGSLGVSTRGVGTVRQVEGRNVVQEDFRLNTVDIVADPSAPDAFVQGIREGQEWIFENGLWSPREYEVAQKKLKEVRREDREGLAVKLFEDYMSRLSR